MVISGSAHCISSGYFGDLVLRLNGYETVKKHLYFNYSRTSNDHAGLAIKLPKNELLLVVDFSTDGNKMSGPYKDEKSLEIGLAHGKPINKSYDFYYHKCGN